MKQIEKGNRVRFTGKFLRNTGQVASSEGKKIFTVLDISKSGFLVVDELTDPSYFTPEEMAADPSLKYRRINAGNVQIVN